MNIKKLYYGLVSLISIIAIAISLWIIISDFWKIILISDEEYLATHSYEINNCNYEVQRKYCNYSDFNLQKKCLQDLKNDKNYQKDLINCKQSKKKEILFKRYYYLKLNLIWTLSTLVVFLILFLFHYPKFKKKS